MNRLNNIAKYRHLWLAFIVNNMEADGEGFFSGMKDTRNVKSKCGARKKPVGQVTKSYSVKAVEKITYSKGEKMAKKMEALRISEEEEKRKEDEEPLDEFTAKKLKKQKEKQQKTEEKKMKKLEKAKISHEEALANGTKHKSKR